MEEKKEAAKEEEKKAAKEEQKKTGEEADKKTENDMKQVIESNDLLQQSKQDVDKLLDKMKLLQEDVKGAAVDVNQ